MQSNPNIALPSHNNPWNVDLLLTVHLSTILVINQLDAQNLVL